MILFRFFFTVIIILIALTRASHCHAKIETSLPAVKESKPSTQLTLKEQLWLDSHPLIPIASDYSWYPFVYVDTKGQLTGFNVALIAQINKNLGTQFRLTRHRNWSVAFDKLSTGDIPALLSVTPTEDRKKYLDFSPVYYFAPQNILSNVDNTDISTIEDLKGKRVAAFKNHIITNLIEKNIETKSLHYVESTEEAYTLLKSNTVDASVITNADHATVKQYNVKIAGSIVNESGNLAIASHKSFPILSSILRKGINSISNDQMNALIKKWHSNNRKKTLFTPDELHFIENNPELYVGIEHWEPIVYSNKFQSTSGIVGDILKEVSTTTGLKFIPVAGTKNQLSADLAQGDIHIYPSSYHSKNSAPDTLSTAPYLAINSSIFIKVGRDDIEELDDLTNKTVAILASSPHHAAIRNKLSSLKLRTVSTVQEGLQLLINEQVDAFIGAELLASHYINTNLTHNIRVLAPQKFLSNELVMKVNRNNAPLRSILAKSLLLISKTHKTNIVEKWVTPYQQHKQSVNFAFGLGIEPHVLDTPQMKGIEYDLIHRILKIKNINIESAVNLPAPLLQQALISNEQIDAKVRVKPQVDSFFYSEPFIEFDNIAITRTVDAIKLESILDLSNMSVSAFTDASKHLGDDYFSLFNIHDRPESYREYKFQQQQIDTFIKGNGDVLIMDRNIFSWHFNNLNPKDQIPLTEHSIFKESNIFYVAFRDKNLRDEFNEGLRTIRASGEYQHIFSQYKDRHIPYKVELTQLLAAIVANNIFSNDTSPLPQLLTTFTTLPYIDRIDVFDKHNRLIEQSSRQSTGTKFYRHQDIINIFDKMALPQGHIEVYFNDDYIKNHLPNMSLIPDITYFEGNNRFQYISAIYRRLNYLDKDIRFTLQEQKYLKTHPVIRFSEVNWRPLSIIEDGKFNGLMADYMNIISSETGIEFSLVESESWLGVIEAFEKQEIDLIPGITDISPYSINGLLTDEFSFFNFAIIMNENASFVDTLSDLTDKSIALPKGDAVYYFIKKTFPQAKIIETESMSAALNLVSLQKADAYVGHMAVAIYQLETHFDDLKIVGQLNDGFSHRILVHKDKALLLSVINKVLASITQSTHKKIRQRWVNKPAQAVVNYEFVYILLLVIALITLIFSYIYRRISQANKHVELTNSKLYNSIEALEEQKHVFETLFYDTADGLLLMNQTSYIDCNRAAVAMLGYQSKNQIIGKTPSEISPQFQPSGIQSTEGAELINHECQAKGNHRFEWVFIDMHKQPIWVEIVLTQITLNNEQITHVVWRDISDKKKLEEENQEHTAQLMNANIKLEQSLSNLKSAQSQLIESEKMASLGGLVAGVAHEINTPVGIGLTAVTHFLELNANIENKLTEQSMKKSDLVNYIVESNETAAILNRNLERTAELVSSFKQVSVDQTSDQMRTFNVKSYIKEVLVSIHHLFKNTQIIVNVECDDTFFIHGYPGAISQIISNLVINASIHAFPDKEGEISIIVSNTNEKMTMTIKDNGKGVEEHNLSKIFEPFYTTNRENGGSGLGLNIVYNLVKNQLSGDIKCQSIIDDGTCFILSFPVVIKSKI